MPDTLKLDLTAMTCRLGKYSNNIEKHGDEDVPCWALPFTGLMLPADQINALFEDKHTMRAWFDTDKTNLQNPCLWLRKCKIDYLDTFEQASVTVHWGEKHASQFDDCRVKILTLVPRVGGLVETSLQVQLYPNRQQLVLVHEHQNREVQLSISDAKVAAKKKDTQQDLPLPAPAMDGSHLPGAAAPADGEKIDKNLREQDTKEFADAAKAQVDAYNAGKPLDGRSERVKHQDRQAGKH